MQGRLTASAGFSLHSVGVAGLRLVLDAGSPDQPYRTLHIGFDQLEKRAKCGPLACTSNASASS